MITNFLWPYLNGVNIEDLWFQQDGATCHTAHQTIALLHEKFPGRVLSRNADRNCPARSCDLTPCDFFLWGYLKSQVYENNPRSIPDLQEEIRRVIGHIEEQVCVKSHHEFH
jgi:hypothetical protein